MAYRTQGVPPKPASKRRRRNVPASYGAAEPVTAPAASPGPRTLGIADAHPLIVDMWHAVQGSVESRFFSAADWERLRWELWHANYAMTGSMSARACAAIQHGLNEVVAVAGDQAPRRYRTASTGCGCGCRGVDARPVQAGTQVGLTDCGAARSSH